MQTPAEWFPILAARLDADQPRIQLLKRYVNGDAPMPEMGRNTKASWLKFQKRSRANWGLIIRESVADRMVPNGITVGGRTDSDVAKQAARIWRDNRMDIIVKDALRFMLTYRVGYMAGWSGDDGKSVLTAESPETMYAATHALQPWRPLAALKWWRDADAGTDHAIVWVQGGYQTFWRESRRGQDRASGADWFSGEHVVTGKAPPVVVFENPGGAGEYEHHLDVIDRINAGVLERLVTTAMQAFRQRALKSGKDTGALPELDAEGNAIDWAAILEPAPGALWDLPPGFEIWESQQTDIRPMLDGSTSDMRTLAAVTRTPMSTLVPDSANQTAEGAAFAREGLVFKAKDRIAVGKVSVAAIILKALEIEGTAVEDTIDVLFEPPAMVSLSEKYAAAMAAKNAGESRKSIQRNILGYSPDQIEQDALDRAEEQLADMALVASLSGEPDKPMMTLDQVEILRKQVETHGIGVRAGLDPVYVAEKVGLDDVKLSGGQPVSLRLPEDKAKGLED